MKNIGFSPSFVATPLSQRHEILSRNTRGSALSYGENLIFLSFFGLERYRDVSQKMQTDERTDRQNYPS